MITARNLTVSLSGKTIVHGVSLEAKAGQLTAIVGPNGSGKTTTMKAIAGELPSKGEITINGHALGSLEPWQLAVKRAVLPQAATIAFPFTVREIVRLGLTVGPNRHAERIEAITSEALAAVDLSGFAGRFYQELSGGEQQRVQLARVLCQVWAPVLDGKPRYLFLDEPVSSLDIKHQLIIMNLARDFAARGGGVVAILHDLNLTAMYADRIFVMHRGRLAAAGSPQEVLSDELISRVFECKLKVGVLPTAGMPFVLPQSAGL